MKSFALGCIVSSLAGALPPVNVIIRVSKGKDYVLIDNSIDGTNAKGNLKWTLTVQTSFNEDTGTQNMRWTHTLETGILITDKVLFEIDFITGAESDQSRVPSATTAIGEDGG